jgi:hypothetical protein
MAEVLRANGRSLGVESAGKWQVRGNGDLVLTDDELVFHQWAPDRELRIARSEILSVDGDSRAHLGKTVGSKLLKVRWRTPDGTEDTIALEVPDLQAWLDALAGPSGS